MAFEETVSAVGKQEFNEVLAKEVEDILWQLDLDEASSFGRCCDPQFKHIDDWEIGEFEIKVVAEFVFEDSALSSCGNFTAFSLQTSTGRLTLRIDRITGEYRHEAENLWRIHGDVY